MPELRSIDLQRHWELGDGDAIEITPLRGGMNSATWLVRTGPVRLVAKSVPVEQRLAFTGGLTLATLVDRCGVTTGAPLPTRTGELVAQHGERTLAVLRWVGGRPLTADPADHAVLGRTLARVHGAMRDVPVASAQPFPWLDEDAAHLRLARWLRPAIGAALDSYRALSPDMSLTFGMLHCDPAPGAFRYREDTGSCGLIDWAAAIRGPLLYDVASAVMYIGGIGRAATLVDAYVRAGLLSAMEVDRGLGPLLRIRWAVQADYFARRSVHDDLTGIAGPEDNAAGLEDARRALGAG